MSGSTIKIRIDNELKKLLIEKTKDIKAGYSYVLRNLIEDYIKGKKKDFDLRLQQEIKEYFNKKKRLKLKEKHKEKLFMYYLIGNTLKTVYKLSSSYLINSGEINMGVINKVIDSVIEIYNNYPEDIKNNLKKEMDNLVLLKDKEQLINKLKLMRLIATKKQIEYEGKNG